MCLLTKFNTAFDSNAAYKASSSIPHLSYTNLWMLTVTWASRRSNISPRDRLDVEISMF